MTMASDHDAATTGLESADYLCAGEPELDTLRARTPTLASKIRPIAVTRCWEWIGARDPRGYGNVRADGGVRKAHLVVYEALRGPIPTGLECDHRCRVPWCVNPEHIELVDHAENVRRGAARWVPGARQRAKRRCPRGHAYTRANTYRDPRTGGRACRACGRERKRTKTTRALASCTHASDIGGETFRRLPQIALADDVVAVEDRARLVPAHLHGDALWDASANHVANSRAS
jgi:HNH endonuclease